MGIVRAARLMSKFGRICLDDMDILGGYDAQTSPEGFALAKPNGQVREAWRLKLHEKSDGPDKYALMFVDTVKGL